MILSDKEINIIRLNNAPDILHRDMQNCCLEIALMQHKKDKENPHFAVLTKDQSLPENPFAKSGTMDYRKAYQQAQQDMLKAGFRRVELPSGEAEHDIK